MTRTRDGMTHQRYAARYADAMLRSRFPHIETEILELNPFRHVIFVPVDQLDATAFGETFRHSIAMASSKVNLVNERPAKFTKLEQVDEKSWGISRDIHVITINDLKIEIEARFPDFPIICGDEFNDDESMTFFYAADTPHRDELDVVAFINSVVDFRKCTLKPRLNLTSQTGTPNSRDENEQTIDYRPLSVRRERKSVPAFVEGAEMFWFQNIGAIASGGEIERISELRRADGSRAYLNAAMPSLSLRQLLLLFDEIYMQPPFEAENYNLRQFLAENRITSDDFMKLVEAGRIILAFSQPEERTDYGFITEISSIDRRSILSRRELGALVLNDMAKIENEYIFTQSDWAPFVREFIRDFSKDLGGTEMLSQTILFPRYAKRNWASWIEGRGAMGIEPNGQGGQFAQAFERIQNKDVRVEAYMFGQEVHIAQALGATYIPPTPHDSYVKSWIEPSRLMADRLSFYRNFNTRYAASWAETQRRKFQPDAIINPIELFQFSNEDIIPISEIIEATKKPSTRRKGLTLFSRLSDLPPEIINEEIKKLREEQRKRLGLSNIFDKSHWLISVGTDLSMFALGISMPPFFSGLSLISEIGRRICNTENIDQVLDYFIADLNAQLGRNEDVDFLVKTSGVAKLISKI